jgi:DNA-binding MarR family transcriptional regulator
MLERTTVSRNAKVLERMGMISREPGADRRESVLSLSAKGLRAVEVADPLWEQAQHDFEERIGAQQADQLRIMLHSV